MKPLLRTFAFLGLAAAAIIVVASCSTQLSLPNQNVELLLGDPKANPPKYVELKPGTAGRLHAALAKLKGHGGVCELTFLDKANGNPDPHFCEKIAARLKTDRVIKSAAATNVGAVDAVVNDPNLMYRVASPDPGDVSDVASLLK